MSENGAPIFAVQGLNAYYGRAQALEDVGNGSETLGHGRCELLILRGAGLSRGSDRRPRRRTCK